MAFVADVLGGIAGSNADKANAAIASQNAGISKQNAAWTAQEGNAAVEQSELKNRARYGATEANQGASGLTVGKGSFGDVLKSEKEGGELNALNIRSNAARQAYGDITQANNYQNQAAIDRYAANAQMLIGLAKGGESLMSGGFGDAFSSGYNGAIGTDIMNSGFNPNGAQVGLGNIGW